MKLKLALVQTDCVLGDESSNFMKARKAVERARAQGAQLVVFPEMYLTGYALKEEMRKHAHAHESPLLAQIGKLATENSVAIAMGFPELDRTSTKIYNSVYFVDRNGESKVQRKMHLVRGEANYFEAGEVLEVFETSLLRVGMMICYDLYFPEVARILALNDADIILVLSADWYPYDKVVAKLIPARAVENSVYLAYCNRVGVENGFHFFGRSCIIDPRGDVICESADQTDLLVGEVDSTLPKRVRQEMGFIRDRRPEVYGQI